MKAIGTSAIEALPTRGQLKRSQTCSGLSPSSHDGAEHRGPVAEQLRVVAVARSGAFRHACGTAQLEGRRQLVSAAARHYGAKGLTGSRARTVETVAQSDRSGEWKSDIDKNFWADDFVPSERFRKDLDQDYAAMKAVLIDLGLAKSVDAQQKEQTK